ncbi:hypothetical protein HU200_010834 [Digitaria exilis]|uniref:Uncharacterized protein n=1 Tax=Digitaria exilis TaxID=1010633 RepID=A0A835KR87_9POAL|nr:hypothetical protein HU200_010834 [Digitaria exilis]
MSEEPSPKRRRGLGAWPGRHLLEGASTGDTSAEDGRSIGQREHDMWTKGVARLLAIADGRKRNA